MVRTTLLTALVCLLPLSGTTPAPPAPGRPAVPPPAASPVPRGGAGWQWPLAPRPAVARPFHAPPTPWGAGHRGVDLTAWPGAAVRAAGPGVVTFAGRVAGRGVVVVAHPGGLRTTYEPVQARERVGARVQAGTVLGTVTAFGSHCLPRACLHWGLRRGQVYVDPLGLLSPGRPVLLPMAFGAGFSPT